MIQFLYHDGVQKEITALERRFRTIRDGLSIFERLCEKQFHPINPQQVIAPAKLHRITQNDIWALWKVELVMPNSGLRPNQFPRMWFAVKGTIIVFLCISSHVDNYNDEEMNHLALSRAADFF
ncbi:hypothetical protein A2W54_02235 [Candidatus Giovannonibacteria bacterium RIFCSPHIGHO2_02_43_13]|uniref:Uncharacterized protein n=1 Tax=Candidatus Giovannonibacteria bacterium RIFCSPHIGHO2_02_43_13 TaxID=1798330 RepID=A0A1F5WVX4_9BACT|nr:MAG: hypothetical protein UW28_C0030G0005 [Parcubacteria group bacterium GW2011_GWA2_44_13]OGF72998.1 MAG: hypothetical protein A3E06_00055 [Candidatus Giovannonibacteria bacterium RIFCSPHIGHO2_12_FULL_44_42]OGF79461.1 MAG: hypothetical protein A2W54_02235 [Candidatus Giovannonibacteria bacterium RIFCSPHIGHO2_02_43_13]OGF89707.1 MAG: hypothetical protein A3I94_00055 [Candidatus Giovannonibacteria bacterium RIFCSPLOWO2_02_FULL_43_54]OGF96588.1 MAG: hypothetical protein A3H08_04370 [Candidatus